MTTYTLTVRVANEREHDIGDYLHEVAAHLVGERVAWTLTHQDDAYTLTQHHETRSEHPAASTRKLALVRG